MRGVFTARFCSAVLLFGLSTAMFAQTGGQCTEAAVKRLAAQEDPAKTDDVYFYNALLDKPIVGRSELDKASQGRRKELSQQRANEKPAPEVPDRVVVSKSGDMAYEYGTTKLEFNEKKNGQKHDETLAYLRVWRAVDGSCKVAAMMYEPEGSSK
jgi:ketosteroid isomerase-like protein